MFGLFGLLRFVFGPGIYREAVHFVRGHPEIDGVLCLLERGQPYGSATVRWLVWKGDTCELGIPGRMVQVPFAPGTVHSALTDNGFWSLRDEVGVARDGIHYWIVYIDRQRQRYLAIWNPPRGGPHAALLRTLEDLLSGLRKPR